MAVKKSLTAVAEASARRLQKQCQVLTVIHVIKRNSKSAVAPHLRLSLQQPEVATAALVGKGGF